jgi:sulfide dehydrogenase cytochrome subunit
MRSLLVALLAVPAFCRADESSGPTAQALALTCYTCHTASENTRSTIPSLRNKTAAELRTRLREYKSGRSQATIMDRIAKAYTDEEIESISAYLAAHR